MIVLQYRDHSVGLIIVMVNRVCWHLHGVRATLACSDVQRPRMYVPNVCEHAPSVLRYLVMCGRSTVYNRLARAVFAPPHGSQCRYQSVVMTMADI